MRVVAILSVLFLCGCGTFPLGTVHGGKSAETRQLDTLTCKNQAQMATSTAARETGDFLLGLTLVGAPVAYQLDKAKQRREFASCMRAKGYAVDPA